MRYDDILRNPNIEFQFDLPRLPVPVVLSDPDFPMFAELSANLVLQHMNLSVSTAVCLVRPLAVHLMIRLVGHLGSYGFART